MSLVTDDGRRPCLSYAVDEVSLWFCHVWKVERDLFLCNFLYVTYMKTLYSQSPQTEHRTAFSLNLL